MRSSSAVLGFFAAVLLVFGLEAELVEARLAVNDGGILCSGALGKCDIVVAVPLIPPSWPLGEPSRGVTEQNSSFSKTASSSISGSASSK
jgi:hypothetical protein